MTKDELMQFEEEIKELYSAGKIMAPVHLVSGNEEQVIEIFREIRPIDWVFSTYRSHLHALLKGVPPEKVKAEILAGHSMHLYFKEYNFFTSSIAGGCLPIAAGAALAIKMKGEGRKVWIFLGEMAAEMGVFHESCKYARNFNLPIVFIIEDNFYSVQTPTRETWGIENDPPPEGRIKVIDMWVNGKVIYYFYHRAYGHQGTGKWVAF